jgi:PASTA domain
MVHRPDEPEARPKPLGLTGPVGLVVAAVAGVALGVVLGNTSGATPHETSVATSLATTSTTSSEGLPDGLVADYQAQIAELEQELEDAKNAQADTQAELLDLQVDTDPVRYAPSVGCDLSVGAPSDFVEKAEWVGPAGFYDFTNSFASFNWGEMFLTVEPGESVTLLVPRDQRNSYLQLWDPATWGAFPPDPLGGSPYVTLVSCADWPTTFIGGFDVNSALCGTLDVYFDEGADPTTIALPFGTTNCGEEEIRPLAVEPGPVPDVRGMGLREARLQLRLAGLVPAVSDGDPGGTDAVVVAQRPSAGEDAPVGDVVGLRTEVGLDN